MYKHATWRALLSIGVVLVLLLAPLHGAQAQDTTGNAGTGQDGREGETDGGDAAPDGLDDVVESEGVADQGEPQAATEDGVLAPKAAVQLFLPALQGGNAPPGQVDAFFTHGWVAEPCSNVVNSSSTRGLWDDMPGPGGANNEAGLLWFVTNDGLNEQCSYRSTIGGLGVVANRVQFRVAVNDNARFRVGLYRISNGVCLPFLAFLTTSTSDDSQFRTTIASFTTSRICRVQLLLTDDPNTFNAAIDTTSALIDYVRLLNGTTQTWQESFTN